MPPAVSRIGRSVLLALAVASVLPWGALAADPLVPTTQATTVTPTVMTVNVNLYRPHALVRQFTRYWCVPAAAQAMLNIVNRGHDRSYRTQARIARRIHRLNSYTYRSKGNDVGGWARYLDSRIGGAWHYAARSYQTRDAAVAAIAESIDRTGHPVGIVVDRGRHAWTVLGYRATVARGDAARTIVGLYVTGSLRRDPWPYRYMSLSNFAVRYTRYHEWQRPVVWEGKFVIVSE